MLGLIVRSLAAAHWSNRGRRSTSGPQLYLLGCRVRIRNAGDVAVAQLDKTSAFHCRYYSRGTPLDQPRRIGAADLMSVHLMLGTNMLRLLIATLIHAAVAFFFLDWSSRQAEGQIDKMLEAVLSTPGVEAPIPPAVVAGMDELLLHRYGTRDLDTRRQCARCRAGRDQLDGDGRF